MKQLVMIFVFINFNDTDFREWMGKVERIRSRPSDNQEGWKEGSEDRGGSKTSWADTVDPRAPSPSNMGPYNKSAAPQDYQVQLDMHYTSLSSCVHCFLTAR